MDVPSQPSSSPGDAGVEVAPGVRIPANELVFSYSRSSGPGGQNVNKRSTKARLRVRLEVLDEALGRRAAKRLRDLAGERLTEADELVITSDESRSQRGNREACLERLRALLVEARHVPRTRKKTRPSRASKRKRLEDKRHRAQIKRLRDAPRRDDHA